MSLVLSPGRRRGRDCRTVRRYRIHIQRRELCLHPRVPLRVWHLAWGVPVGLPLALLLPLLTRQFHGHVPLFTEKSLPHSGIGRGGGVEHCAAFTLRRISFQDSQLLALSDQMHKIANKSSTTLNWLKTLQEIFDKICKSYDLGLILILALFWTFRY